MKKCIVYFCLLISLSGYSRPAVKTEKAPESKVVESLLKDKDFILLYSEILNRFKKTNFALFKAASEKLESDRTNKNVIWTYVSSLGFKTVSEYNSVILKESELTKNIALSHPELNSENSKKLIATAISEGIKRNLISVNAAKLKQLVPSCEDGWLFNMGICYLIFVDQGYSPDYIACVDYAAAIYWLCFTNGG